jgi:hypothetical protein
MATRKSLFLKPSFGNVAPPTAGGAYQNMPASPLATAAPKSIAGVGQGNMALSNLPAQTKTGLGALGSSGIKDLAAIAAVLGGASMLGGSKTPTAPVAPKPITPTAPVITPKAPTVPPVTPKVPTSGITGGAPNGAGTGTTGGLDVSGNVVYPKDPSGGTPYDEDGNLMPGWQLNENNDPVYVGVQSPLTPPPVPQNPNLPPVDDITPKPVQPMPPSGGLNQVTPKTSTPLEPEPEEEPVEEGNDENGFVSYAEDEDGNIWGISADGEQTLFMPVNQPFEPETVPESEFELSSEPTPEINPEPEPEEPTFAQDDAGNIYELVDGEWYMVQEASPVEQPLTEYPVQEYPIEYPVDDSMNQPYTGEPDYYDDYDYSQVYDYKNGGLMQAKKYAGGGYAGGGEVYVVDSIDNGDGTYTQQYSDGSQETYDNPTNASVYTPSGTSGTTPMTTSSPSFLDNLGLGNLDFSGLTGSLSSVGDFMKKNPVLSGTSAALIMNLLSSQTGNSGTNYKPDMAAAGVKPHTTDFGLGPARVVPSGNQSPYYSPEQAAQLNTYLGVPGYDIQREDPNAAAAAPQGGLAAATPMADGGMAAASQHYSYGKPVDPMEVLGIRQPPVTDQPETQAVAKGGLMQPKGPLGVPMAEGRHDYRKGAAVNGPGDGQSDDIPAMLADGEYVIDAELVAMLGNGSNKAGAKVLDQFRENVRLHKRSAPLGKIPPKSKSPLEYMKGTKNG